MKNKILVIVIGLVVTGVLYVYVSGNKFHDRVNEEVRAVLRSGDSGSGKFLAQDLFQLKDRHLEHFQRLDKLRSELEREFLCQFQTHII